jgi:hypothetical protein
VNWTTPAPVLVTVLVLPDSIALITKRPSVSALEIVKPATPVAKVSTPDCGNREGRFGAPPMRFAKVLAVSNLEILPLVSVRVAATLEFPAATVRSQSWTAVRFN